MTRARWFVAVIAIVAAAAVAQAQTPGSTVDGVSALARGDVQRAAEILRPLAEDWRRSDATAAFFMATMYESGRGVPLDSLRACALYHQMLFKDSLFAAQANILFKRLFLTHDRDWQDECQYLGNTGLDHHFEPATFTLGPAHTVAWDFMGATVTYQGQSTRVPVRIATRGARFLPLRHTRLTTGGFRPESRDYIELFVWRPAGDKWSLDWFLYEVLGKKLIGVAGKTSVIASATPSDARDSVTLRVNQDGHAEFSVRGNARTYTEVLVSEAEKEEERERERARSAADARVDWNRRGDPGRPPSLLYADSSGCANILLYGWSDDRMEIMTFRVDDGALHLPSSKATTFKIGAKRSVSLNVHVYERPLKPNFCSDLGPPTPPGELWRAVAGSVTIDVSPRGIRARAPHLYQATVRIVNGVFVNESGRRVRQTAPITLTALVGAIVGGARS